MHAYVPAGRLSTLLPAGNTTRSGWSPAPSPSPPPPPPPPPLSGGNPLPPSPESVDGWLPVREEEWRTWGGVRDQTLRETMQSRKNALLGWKDASNGDAKGLLMLATVGVGRTARLAAQRCRTMQDRDLATDSVLALMALIVLRVSLRADVCLCAQAMQDTQNVTTKKGIDQTPPTLVAQHRSSCGALATSFYGSQMISK